MKENELPFADLDSTNVETQAVHIRQKVLELAVLDADLCHQYRVAKHKNEFMKAQLVLTLLEEKKYTVKELDARCTTDPDCMTTEEEMQTIEAKWRGCKNLLQTYSTILESIPSYIGRGSTLIRSTNGY